MTESLSIVQDGRLLRITFGAGGWRRLRRHGLADERDPAPRA
ncbi:hypothetical protein [Roseomonas harenae]|nr:hypothetical protein [Roseomonas harenae]